MPYILPIPVKTAVNVAEEQGHGDDEDVLVEVVRVARALVGEAVDVAVDVLRLGHLGHPGDHQPDQEAQGHERLDWNKQFRPDPGYV